MPGLDPEKVQRAIDAHIGGPDSVTAGEHNYVCPFCDKAGYNVPSHLHVNYWKGVALCHQCRAGFKSLHTLVLAVFGRIPTGLGEQEENDESLTDEIDKMLWPDKAERKKAKQERVKLPDSFVPLTERPKDRLGRVVLRYLTKERGVAFRHLVDVGCGYCTQGALRGYAIFPIHMGGELISYTSRRVVGTGPKVRHARAGKAASVALFNYDNAVEAKRVIIGEGPFDAWALHRRVRPTDAGMATLGTVLHDEQARLIAELPCSRVVIWYDADAMDKATEAAKRVLNICDKKVSIVRHTGPDPDELDEDELARLLKGAEPYNPFLTEIEAMLG